MIELGQTYYNKIHGDMVIYQIDSDAVHLCVMSNNRSIPITEKGLLACARLISTIDSPNVFGVGYTGSAEYKTTLPMYQTWRAMLKRCYEPTSLAWKVRPVVCKEWHSYQAFAVWYEANKPDDKRKHRFVLDRGANEYNGATCRFKVVLRPNG